jgi:hypothetical protein
VYVVTADSKVIKVVQGLSSFVHAGKIPTTAGFSKQIPWILNGLVKVGRQETFYRISNKDGSSPVCRIHHLRGHLLAVVIEIVEAIGIWTVEQFGEENALGIRS